MAKIWKKLGLLILIIACLFNIVSKLTTKVSLNDEISASADYVKELVTQEELKTTN